ncbi:hypothetical protein LOTGIDRAFT_158354 [Lottia gigantea]|uniref:Uncharacterized protein n=1 Tax=Lottia gigantea TaxID=225164 RepID=V4APY3_LOTGI|nr:hypothetical protein LOTGIDRAFT_158354 [Lottia gigantea]ESO99277.1 hypothetical protein LOTGIDRAFT_158354 [Lottia gigantea]
MTSFTCHDLWCIIYKVHYRKALYNISHDCEVLKTAAECPLNAMYQAQMCTATLGIGPPQGPTPFVEKGKIEIAKLSCRENRLNNAVQCLEEIMNACQGNTEREHFLRMMINVESIKRSVQYFCDNLHIYEENAECVADSHEDQKKCAQDVRNNFKTKVDSTSNMDVMMTSTCRFYNIAVGCIQTIVRPKCGNDAVDIVIKMLQGFQPPKCKELDLEPGYRVTSGDQDNSDNQGSDANKISQSISVLLLLSFTIKLFI